MRSALRRFAWKRKRAENDGRCGLDWARRPCGRRLEHSAAPWLAAARISGAEMDVVANIRVCHAFSSVVPKADSSSTLSNFLARRRSLELPIRPAALALFVPTTQGHGSFSKFQRGRWSFPSELDNPVVHGVEVEALRGSNLVGGVIIQDLEPSSDDSQNGASSPDLNGQLLTAAELSDVRADPVRSRLIKKLSEANQYNRHLLREVQMREEVIKQSKSRIASLELELGVLVKIAQEIAKDGGKPGTRKINGRYIHSHLAVRLEECVCALLSHFQTWGGDENLLSGSTTSIAREASELQKTLFQQLQDLEAVRSRELQCVWHGMAQSVVVMGSFDDWSHGESMSPESTGTFTKFTTKLSLLPGRYEIKFKVDGQWRLSDDLPTVGEGLMMNNLLIVE